MTVWRFFAIKAATIVAALFVVGALWFLVPAVILWGFDLNLLWITAVWGWVSPLLPLEASIPLEAIEQAHSAMVMLVQGMAKILPELTARQVETATRAVLGEGWILVAEISLPLRLYWVWRWQ